MWTISASGLKTPTPRNATHSHTHARYVFILPPRHGGSCSPVRCRPPKLHSTRRPEVQQRDMAKGQRVSAEKGRTAESCGRREAMYHFFPESLRGGFSSLAQPSGHDGDTEREFHLLHFFWPRHLLSPLHPPLLFQTATLASVRNLRCPLVGTPVSRQTCIPLSPGDARRPLEPVSCCPAGPTANPGVLRKTHGERRKAASPWDHTAPHSPCTYVCGGHQSHRCSSARYGEQGTGPRSPNWAGVTLGPESRCHPPSLSERSRTQLLGRKLPSFCYFLISH